MTDARRTEERDPRIDPAPGDILEMKPGCCLFRHVEIVRNGRVTFHSRCGNQWFNSSMRDTLEEWREIMRDARVTHVGAP